MVLRMALPASLTLSPDLFSSRAIRVSVASAAFAGKFLCVLSCLILAAI